MKLVVFLFAVAVFTVANPVEKAKDVTKEDIENLLDDYVKILKSESSFVLNKQTKFNVEIGNVIVKVVCSDKKRGIGDELSIRSKRIDLRKNSLEVNVSFTIETDVSANASVNGTVDGVDFIEEQPLKGFAEIAFDNRFKFSLGENSVTLEANKTGDITFIHASGMQRSGFMYATVPDQEIIGAAMNNSIDYLKSISVEMQKQVRPYLNKEVLGSKNLSQHVSAIKKYLSNKLA